VHVWKFYCVSCRSNVVEINQHAGSMARGVCRDCCRKAVLGDERMSTYCNWCLKYSNKAEPAAYFRKGAGPLCGACKLDFDMGIRKPESQPAPAEVEKVVVNPGPVGDGMIKVPQVVETGEIVMEDKMELCEKCLGEKKRPKGHTGRHTMLKAGAGKVAHVKAAPSKAAPAKVAKMKEKVKGTLSGLSEIIASEIAALDEKRDKLVAVLKTLKGL